jgi:hypothetical protein
MALKFGATATSSTVDVGEMVGRFISARQISHREYHQLCAAILSDNQIDEDERTQINRLFDAIQSGQLKVVS